MSQKTETAPNESNNGVVIGAFTDYGNMEKLLAYCKPIAESKISPFDRAEDVAAVFLWAKDKGISAIDALNRCFIINGRVSIDSHLTRALLQRANIYHVTVENYRPLYQYIYPVTGLIFTQDDVDKNPDKFTVWFSENALKAAADKPNYDKTKTPIIRSDSPVDHRTKIQFTRFIPLPDGSHFKQTVISEYTILEAETAGLLTKDNWQKYPKDCLFGRSYSRGAREIGDDKLFGMMLPEELGSTEYVMAPIADDEIPETPYEDLTKQ